MSASGTLQGYSVSIGGLEYIVIASNIAEAAAGAMRSKDAGGAVGEITSIRHLGAALV